MAMTLEQILGLMDTFRTSKGAPRLRERYSTLPIVGINAIGWAGTKSLLYRSEIRSEVKSDANYLTYIQFYGLEVTEQQTTRTPTPVMIDGNPYWFSIPTARNPVSMSCMCFAEDTLIPLADGYSVPIKNLVGKDEFYVYSFDTKQKKVVIGRGHSARKTGIKEVVKVTFDDGTTVTVTDDHRFLLKDGTYKEVRDISSDESIESLYRFSSDKSDSASGYEKVLQAHHNTSEFTHALSDQFNQERGLGGYIGESRVRHHIDFNNRNNNPDNIVGMKYQDHQNYHAALVSNDCIGVNRMIKLRKEKVANGMHHWLQDSHRLATSAIQRELVSQGKHNFQSAEWRQTMPNSETQEKLRRAKALTVVKDCLTNYGSFTEETAQNVKRRGFPGYSYITANYDVQDLIKEASNHKILKVEVVGVQDVYCFEVDEHHNFAIDLEGGKKDSSGIFVHNCSDFTFTWEKELFDVGSLIGRWRPYQRKTVTYPPRNPLHVPGVCKHLWSLITQLSQNDLLYQR